MTIFNASDYGIVPNHDITAELIDLIQSAGKTDGEKTIVFEKGTYYIDSEKCNEYMLYITNTVGDKEFSLDEKPHLNAVPFYFSGIDNLIFDGSDSVFVIDGKVTNIAIENCKNITVKNMEIRHTHPDMHELKVVNKTMFYVDFEIDRDSLYKIIGGKLCFYGKDYNCLADERARNAHWIGLIRAKTPDKIQRVSHSLIGTVKSVSDLGNRRIRVYYLNTLRFKKGDCFYLFDVRRQFAGVFVNQSENVVLDHIKQRFNYSLALVAQNSKDVSLIDSEFAPEENSARKMVSVADFIQICMCRGSIKIENNLFDGSGDDCLNVHGIHFKIMHISGNKIIVRFMHPQSHGFNPLRKGDKIAFIRPDDLLEYDSAVIENTQLLNEYEIELTLDSAKGAVKGDVIEDISACPQVLFKNNVLNRIITRGLLLTTRGEVVVENNHFKSNYMSSILLSDDAKSWYESGMCRDVTIKNNQFDYCCATPVLIKPENKKYNGAVHKNIKIINNCFNHYKGYAVRAKSSDDILISGNKFLSDKIIRSANCRNVVVKNNDTV